MVHISLFHSRQLENRIIAQGFPGPSISFFHLSFETLQHFLQIKKLEIQESSCSTNDAFDLTWPLKVPRSQHFQVSVRTSQPSQKTRDLFFASTCSPSFTGSFLDIGQDTFKFCFVAKKLALQQVHPSVYNLNPQLWWLQIPL